IVQFSRMTRKRQQFPCYGMQWGQTVYLYPIEESLVEAYVRPPKPAQQIEARMYGGTWSKTGNVWTLTWTPDTIKDFYLNNVLIHEVGHIYDERNTAYQAREHYANWFAIEYGYRASRGRLSSRQQSAIDSTDFDELSRVELAEVSDQRNSESALRTVFEQTK